MENFADCPLNTYLEKHAFLPKQIQTHPAKNLGVVVVIPCFNEPDILGILNSLKNCRQPGCPVEVIVVVNASKNVSEEIRQTNLERGDEVREFSQAQVGPDFKVFLIITDELPTKHAGVGLARKIGMDEAVRRLEEAGKTKGLILNVDSDCRVEPNYLFETWRTFEKNESVKAATIYYEHPLSGCEPAETYKAIVLYELYLRYYIIGLRFVKYPYAFQTLGSCMAVRSSVYQQQGGMNKRKAGEDFYFLHKLMPLGGFVEINSTCVYPSPRVSDRVPFGTGKAVSDWLNEPNEDYPVYHPQIFSDLKILFEKLREIDFVSFQSKTQISGTSRAISEYLDEIQFWKALVEIHKNSSNQKAFTNRLFRWFDGLRVLKMVHHLRDRHYGQIGVNEAAGQMLKMLGSKTVTASNKELLQAFRKMDRAGWD